MDHFEKKSKPLVRAFLLNILLFSSLILVGVRSGYFKKQLTRIGLMETSSEKFEDNWQAYHAVIGWEKTLQTLNVDCDICFYGNSITNQIPFADSIIGKKVTVIGYPGAGFDMLHYTAPLVRLVKPKKLFIMAGINSLGYMDNAEFTRNFNNLLDSILPTPFYCEVYLESMLPLNHDKGKNSNLSNKRIEEGNAIIQRIANERNFTYIDLYHDYVNQEGEMPAEYTRDGTHLYPEAYDIWLKKIRKYVK